MTLAFWNPLTGRLCSKFKNYELEFQVV
uniref:Uncharacterized protein n=1 Tax=Rhizophora mucronata TaxID=61149 RepID=A0A2P2NXG5_RHIMU